MTGNKFSCQCSENVPVIAVQTKPKRATRKKSSSHTRSHRFIHPGTYPNQTSQPAFIEMELIYTHSPDPYDIHQSSLMEDPGMSFHSADGDGCLSWSPLEKMTPDSYSDTFQAFPRKLCENFSRLSLRFDPDALRTHKRYEHDELNAGSRMGNAQLRWEVLADKIREVLKKEKLPELDPGSGGVNPDSVEQLEKCFNDIGHDVKTERFADALATIDVCREIFMESSNLAIKALFDEDNVSLLKKLYLRYELLYASEDDFEDNLETLLTVIRTN